MKGHPLFRFVWVLQDVLFILSAASLLWALYWEHSTREYLRGFADAVVPANASNLEKVESILNWMKSGPSRRIGASSEFLASRDPEQTLNYRSLLQVCGSATNAFINLALADGISVRRLLLLNSRGVAAHVDAEVLLDGKWIVVDPAFRRVMQSPAGDLFTAQQLRSPEVLKLATAGLPDYLPEYSFSNTSHLHTARFGFVGAMVARAIGFVFPGWDQSEYVTLLVERDSFALTVAFVAGLLLCLVLRFTLSWYADTRLGVQRTHLVDRLRRGRQAFLGQMN